MSTADKFRYCRGLFRYLQKKPKTKKKTKKNAWEPRKGNGGNRVISEWPKKKKIYKKTGAKLKKKKTTNWTQRNEWNDELFRLSPSTLLPIESHRRRPL